LCQIIHPRPVTLFYVNFELLRASLHEIHLFHSTFCLKTGPQPLLKPVPYRVRSTALWPLWCSATHCTTRVTTHTCYTYCCHNAGVDRRDFKFSVI